jgi:hypothetical protein
VEACRTIQLSHQDNISFSGSLSGLNIDGYLSITNLPNSVSNIKYIILPDGEICTCLLSLMLFSIAVKHLSMVSLTLSISSLCVTSLLSLLRLVRSVLSLSNHKR